MAKRSRASNSSRLQRESVDSIDGLHYPLPVPLIKEIQKELKLWTPREEDCEINLAKESGGAIVDGQPKETYFPEDFDESAADRCAGPELDVCVEAIREWSRAYLGWLFITPDYWNEVCALRKSWSKLFPKGYITPDRVEPLHRQMLKVFDLAPPFFRSELSLQSNEMVSPAILEGIVTAHERLFLVQRLAPIYQRWGIASFVTWDLPVPVRVSRVSPGLSENQLPDIESGVTVFLPWYVLKKKDVDIRALVDTKPEDEGKSHLRDWFNYKEGKVRLTRSLRMYLYWVLALRRRYGDRLHGRLGAVDRAFHQYFSKRKHLKGHNDPSDERSVSNARRAVENASRLAFKSELS